LAVRKKALVSTFASCQFAVFLLVGGACGLVNFGAGALVRTAWQGRAAYAASVAMGFAVGTALSFLLNRRYTFQAQGAPLGIQAVRFALLAFGSIALSALVGQAILGTLSAWLVPRKLSYGASETIAHLATIAIMAVFNFLAMKFYALRRPDAVPPPEDRPSRLRAATKESSEGVSPERPVSTPG
jgi:putative flippase GtrA